MNSYTVEINASPERVFSWLDDPQRSRQWIPNLVEDEIITETENKVGSTWRQVYLENGRRMEMLGTTTIHEPGRRLRCDIKGNMFELDVDYRLEDLGGRTRLTQTVDMKMKGVFKLMGVLMSPFINKTQQKQQIECFNKLKQLVENEAESVAEV